MNKYGFPEKDWDAAVKEGTDALITYAKRRQMVTYTDFLSHLRSIRFDDPHDFRLGYLLGDISRSEVRAGRGMLSALVVHKIGDYQPGKGFFELAEELGYETDDIEKMWIQQIKKVYAAWAGPKKQD